MSAPYCNERFGTYAANALSYVAHHIGDYLPDEVLLEGTELVVRIPDMTSMPTVELYGNMPIPAEKVVPLGTVTHKTT